MGPGFGRDLGRPRGRDVDADWLARSIAADTGVPLDEARPLIDAIIAAERSGDAEQMRETTAALGFAVWMAAKPDTPAEGGEL